MRTIVTGASGLVGRAMVKHFAATPLTHAELDIADGAAVKRIVAKLRPELIINCAVIGVDECEQHQQLADAVNVNGPGNLAEAAEKAGAALVHFSSNYVFDGRERNPYATDDPPNPINTYGRTKLTGECAVFFRCSRAFVVRSSWIFGRGKPESFVSSVHEKLRAGERVQAVSDVWASVTYVEDLASGVAKLIDAGKPGLYHVVNDGVVTYESFAHEAARLIHANERLIEPVHTRDVHKARRPRYTPLRSSVALRDWREALAEFVKTTSS